MPPGSSKRAGNGRIEGPGRNDFSVPDRNFGSRNALWTRVAAFRKTLKLNITLYQTNYKLRQWPIQ